MSVRSTHRHRHRHATMEGPLVAHACAVAQQVLLWLVLAAAACCVSSPGIAHGWSIADDGPPLSHTAADVAALLSSFCRECSSPLDADCPWAVAHDWDHGGGPPPLSNSSQPTLLFFPPTPLSASAVGHAATARRDKSSLGRRSGGSGTDAGITRGGAGGDDADRSGGGIGGDSSSSSGSGSRDGPAAVAMRALQHTFASNDLLEVLLGNFTVQWSSASSRIVKNRGEGDRAAKLSDVLRGFAAASAEYAGCADTAGGPAAGEAAPPSSPPPAATPSRPLPYVFDRDHFLPALQASGHPLHSAFESAFFRLPVLAPLSASDASQGVSVAGFVFDAEAGSAPARYLFAGPPGTGVGFHAHAESAALLLRGQKLWLLYSDERVQQKCVSAWPQYCVSEYVSECVAISRWRMRAAYCAVAGAEAGACQVSLGHLCVAVSFPIASRAHAHVPTHSLAPRSHVRTHFIHY